MSVDSLRCLLLQAYFAICLICEHIIVTHGCITPIVLNGGIWILTGYTDVTVLLAEHQL